MTHPLVTLIDKAVVAYPKPCVNISGGIDSTIILHHLTQKTDENIYTYTVGFKGEEPEFNAARQVANHYDTAHTEIIIEEMLPRFPQILQLFDKPRYNLWPYWIAEQAKHDKRQSCYIGEGGDEHFGGYWYKPRCSYVEAWSNFFHYVMPTYQTVYNHFGIQLVVPLHPDNLSWTSTWKYYDHQQEKAKLREVYKDILPDFVVDRKKRNGRKDYWVMWRNELQQYFPDAKPLTEDDVRFYWNLKVSEIWLKTHNEQQLVAQTSHL